MGMINKIVREGIIPQKTIKLIAASDEESGGEKGLGWLIDNTDHFNNINLVLSEGGGFPLPVDDKTYITVQTGERERIRLKKRNDRSNILEDLKQVAIDDGIEAKAFNQDTKDYLSYFISDETLEKKRRIGIENFNNYIFDYQEDTTFIYQMPFTSINDIFKEEDVMEHIQTGKIKDLSKYLKIIQAQLTKIDSKFRILPFVTPGFSDNRYFRLKGIDTIGFFPLDVNNRISGIHGINEYITKESIELSFEILYQLVKNIAF
jgi:acetylornithine deacetylase/succinyl-diaminopimelate desuccinylase-like protein